jgi:predicted outer membrane repeat protein
MRLLKLAAFILTMSLTVISVRAAGNVTNCTVFDDGTLPVDTLGEALVGGGFIDFGCSGTIPVPAEIAIIVATTIDGSAENVTLSTSNTARLFNVNPGAMLTLVGLTLSNSGTAGLDGGAILNDGGTVSLQRTAFLSNTGNLGGAVRNTNNGALTITNSTFTGNSAAEGGAIYTDSNLVALVNVTIASNTGTTQGGGLHLAGGAATLTDAIVSANTGGNCTGPGAVTGTGGNLIFGSACGALPDGGLDPQLGAQTGNPPGLLPGLASPAIDFASACLAEDQVAAGRPVDFPGATNTNGTGCDSGALERQNSVPIAVNDSYSTSTNTTLNIAAPGVLSNDTDADGALTPLTATLVSGPANASAFTLNADGSFTYTPNTGFAGTDSFTYRATDGLTTSADATVTITIGGPPIYVSNPAAGSSITVNTLPGFSIFQSIQVTNNGGMQLVASSVTLTGSSQISLLTPSSFTLNPSTSTNISFQCLSAVVGFFSATLQVTHNASGSPANYFIGCNVSTTLPTATPIGGATAIPTVGIPTAIVPTPTVFVPPTATVVEVSGLSIRNGPYLGATLLGVARPGITYNILAFNKDEGLYPWYQIPLRNGRKGWVSGRYLLLAGTTDSLLPAGSPYDQIDNPVDVGVRLITEAIIDLRPRPTPRMKPIASIPAHTEVIVVGRTMQGENYYWIQVVYNGLVGWIPFLPVEIRGDLDSVPVR